MTGVVPVRARKLAGQLDRLFGRDQQLACRLNDAHQRLRAANDRLWSGLSPDGLTAVYGDHPQFQAVQLEAAFDSRSEVLESADPLGALQEVHWQIHRAQVDYQAHAEQRRQLAADVGELIARLVDALVAAGWSETDARDANVHQLAEAGEGA